MGQRRVSAARSARVRCGALLGLGLELASGLWAQSSAAQEEPTTVAAAPVELHAFVSQGFILSAKNEYLANSKHGSLELS